MLDGMPELSELVDTYTAPAEARELVESNPPALLVGITGAGKDTTKQELLKSDDFSEIVSHTTRLPRLNNGRLERDGVDYHFVSRDFMYNMARWHKFVEVKRVHKDAANGGEIYGTSIAELAKARSLGKIAVTDLDVQGVREYKELSDKTVALFILPPDYDTWRDRLSARYDDSAAFDAEWAARSRTAIAELEEALSLPYYHFIINQDIGHTALVASQIAHRGDIFKRGDDEARLRARDLLDSIRSQA
jgi:guanylate kinase